MMIVTHQIKNAVERNYKNEPNSNYVVENIITDVKKITRGLSSIFELAEHRTCGHKNRSLKII